jgi:hypothetical protein
MKTFLVAASVAAAMLAGASGASAAQFTNWSPVNADGSFSGNFGDTGISTPTFTDAFNFTLPTGMSSFTVNSTFTDNIANNIDFTSVTYDGTAFNIVSTGQNEFQVLNGVGVTSGGVQHLVVSGTSGGSGSYDGVISFSRLTAVPEPTAWALMIMGFGGVGGVVRSRRRQAATA